MIGKQGTDGERKHVTLMILQKLEIFRGLESGKSWSVIMDLHHVESPSACDIKKQKDQLQLFVASSECVKGILKWQIERV